MNNNIISQALLSARRLTEALRSDDEITTDDLDRVDLQLRDALREIDQ